MDAGRQTDLNALSSSSSSSGSSARIKWITSCACLSPGQRENWDPGDNEIVAHREEARADMAHALGRPMGAMGTSVSCIFGQLLASAEIEEVRGLPCWALDLESLTSDDVMRKKRLASCTHISAPSDGLQACQQGISSRRRVVTDLRWTLCLLRLTPSEHE